AADDGAGCDVPQPRRRDRADQRRGVEGMLGPLPQGGARGAGDADPWATRTQRRGGQRGRRAPGVAADAGEDRQPRFPLTAGWRFRPIFRMTGESGIVSVVLPPFDLLDLQPTEDDLRYRFVLQPVLCTPFGFLYGGGGIAASGEGGPRATRPPADEV